MKLVLDEADLTPLIERVVEVVVARLFPIAPNGAGGMSRLSYTEAEAASLMGVPKHVLRDARLRGEITGGRTGKRVTYSREELARYLATRK